MRKRRTALWGSLILSVVHGVPGPPRPLAPRQEDPHQWALNAICHGAHPEDADFVEVVLWPADGHYWLAVSDPGTGSPTPVVGCLDAGSENGRGLVIVNCLATAWTVRPRPVRGTSVIAGLPLQRRE